MGGSNAAVESLGFVGMAPSGFKCPNIGVLATENNQVFGTTCPTIWGTLDAWDCAVGIIQKDNTRIVLVIAPEGT